MHKKVGFLKTIELKFKAEELDSGANQEQKILENMTDKQATMKFNNPHEKPKMV